MSSQNYLSNEYDDVDVQSEKEGHRIDFQKLLVWVLVHWPWFVTSVVVCVIFALVYVRYETPIYHIDGAVLITEQQHTRSRNAAGIDLQNLGVISMTNNFDNEIEILQSRSLVRKVVSDLGLYIHITRSRSFGAPSPVYKTSPVTFYVSPEVADTLPAPVRLEVRCHPDGTYDIESACSVHHEVVEQQYRIDSLPAVIHTPVCAISLTSNPAGMEVKNEMTLLVDVVSLNTAARAYMSALSVEPRSKTTTIAQIDMEDSHPRRGMDFVNSLVSNYNQDANDDKNQVAQKTAEFIEERLALINRELTSAETQMADFKQSAGLTNLANDAQLALTQNVRYEQERINNFTQINLVEYLQTYITDAANQEEVIPSNVGLQDATLSGVINQYNTQLLEYKRLQRTSSDINPVLIPMRERLEVLRSSVEATIASTLQGLRIAKANIDRQNQKYQTRVNNAPRQEKEFLTLSRQQEIMATLYTLLLQKREENAITLAATANNGRLIEDPVATTRPVAPSLKKILFVALLLGLLLPFLMLYVIELTKYKIENPTDVEELTDVPLVAEIPVMPASQESAVVVRENRNGIAEEAFRALRTNLLFLLKGGQKVVMFSSTQSGEGKSFVTANTAMSMAILGKKVLVVGMDIRKPGLNKTFGFSRRQRGVTEYLSSPDTASLNDLIIHGVGHDHLDVLLGGTIPPNPTELVSRDALDRMVGELRGMYDYILIDTAPIGMVADSAIIARVADVCLYVCRADFTPKAGFAFVNRLAEEHKFDQMGIILNGFDIKKRKNNNAYARRYGYGYGYGSSYGYGYGMEDEEVQTSDIEKQHKK